MTRFVLLALVISWAWASGCGRIPPAQTANVPPPWPAPDPPVQTRGTATPPPEETPAKPAVPKMKPDVLPSPTPTPPQS